MNKIKFNEIETIWCIKRRCVDVHVRRCGRVDITATGRGRDKPKKYWRELTRQGITISY